jgi:hypothetical protein
MHPGKKSRPTQPLLSLTFAVSAGHMPFPVLILRSKSEEIGKRLIHPICRRLASPRLIEEKRCEFTNENEWLRVTKGVVAKGILASMPLPAWATPGKMTQKWKMARRKSQAEKA